MKFTLKCTSVYIKDCKNSQNCTTACKTLLNKNQLDHTDE